LGGACWAKVQKVPKWATKLAKHGIKQRKITAIEGGKFPLLRFPLDPPPTKAWIATRIVAGFNLGHGWNFSPSRLLREAAIPRPSLTETYSTYPQFKNNQLMAIVSGLNSIKLIKIKIML